MTSDEQKQYDSNMEVIKLNEAYQRLLKSHDFNAVITEWYLHGLPLAIMSELSGNPALDSDVLVRLVSINKLKEFLCSIPAHADNAKQVNSELINY